MINKTYDELRALMGNKEIAGYDLVRNNKEVCVGTNEDGEANFVEVDAFDITIQFISGKTITFNVNE